MSERLLFVQACLDRRHQIVAICDRFGISEKTGHKWLRRFREAGYAGLGDQSHAPRHRADLVAPEVVARILALRRQHPLYGAEKLRDWLIQNEPDTRWPAASTIGLMLQRAGLVRRRRRSRTASQPVARSRTVAAAPNAVWTADFKGQFRLGLGPYCYPLTVLDLHSHYLLGCTALATVAIAPTRQRFLRLFREYGLPDVVRTDNGVPFAQPNAAGRLGALSYWFVRLGIRPEFIRPARPAENGAHERFHRTLKDHTARPPAISLTAQQKRFDRFRDEYNAERPHEHTVERRPPATMYTPSSRPYPEKLPALIYPGNSGARLVDGSGNLKWRNIRIFASTNLVGELIGITETSLDQIELRFGQLLLGSYDLHTQRFIPRFEWEELPTP